MYEKVVRQFVFPLLEIRSRYLSYLNEMIQIQWKEPAVLEERLLKKIRHIVAYAYDTVPYYRNKFRELGITPDEIRSLKRFGHLPTLSRKQLVENFRGQGISRTASSWRRRLTKTTGTTGQPVLLYVDRASSGTSLAIRSLFDTWTGVSSERRRVAIRAHPSFAERILFNRHEIPTDSFSSKTLVEIACMIKRSEPDALEGYPSYLVRLARLEDLARDLSPSAVVSYGEILPESHRKLMSSAFGCPVFDRYGAAELGGPIAHECEIHNGLHVNTEGTYIEIVRDGEEASEGEEGQVIATSLTNEIMPLIRYELGDLAVKGSSCSCGRGFPLIQDLKGRSSESVRTSTGEEIPLVSLLSCTDVFAEYLEWVGFEQPRDGLVNIRIFPGAQYSRRIGEALVSYVQQKMPNLKCSIKIEQAIPNLTGGKTLIKSQSR